MMKTIPNLFKLACLGAGIGLLNPAVSTEGATATVIVGNGGGLTFSPATTDIFAHDSVIWTWSGSFHSTTAGTNGTPSGLWDSEVQNPAFSFTNTFDDTGTFPYYCSVHYASGMVGSVVVADAPPPTATVLVGSGGLSFSPATATIPVNGRIIWSWSGAGHSTTSGDDGSPTGDGLWNSGVNNPPHSFTNTFNTAGSFPYYCIPHFSLGMKGTIVVTNAAAPNLPPTVTITNPASGTTLSAPASFTLAANATDDDGDVTNVQFLQGATPLGNVFIAPFSMAVNNLAAGDYDFSAVASDNDGLTATNSITVHVINAGPVAVSAPGFLSANNFQFSYTADIGLSYVVQVSTNLLDWTPLATNTATTSPVIFSDPNAGGGAAFYRVGRLPNP